MLKLIKYFFLGLAIFVLVTVLVILGWVWRAGEALPAVPPPTTHKLYDTRFKPANDAALAAMTQAREQQLMPSLSAAVSIDGKLVWAAAVGYRDIAGAVPAELSTGYRIGSISKSLTGTLLVKLAEQNRVGLHEPLQTYTGELEPWSQITLHQLASHRAGVRHYRGGLAMMQENFRNTHYASAEQALPLIGQSQPLFPPGSDFKYSTYGYTLLTHALEKATGESFGMLLERNILRPAQMQHTMLHNPAKIDTEATPYMTMGETNYRAPEVDLSYKHAGGGVLSTPGDLIRFANALLDHTLLNKTSREQLWEIALLDNGQPNPQNYAMGFRINQTDWGMRASHGGKSVGGHSFLAVYPDKNMAVAFTTNAIPEDNSLDRDALAQAILAPFIALAED